MKRLVLSGALLLAAAMCVTDAKAEYAESNIRVEKSYGAPTPSPSSGVGDDYSWNVYGIPNGYTGTSNAVQYNINLRNGRGDASPVLTESLIQTGASLIKNFTWINRGTPRPTTVTVTHAVACYGNLSVYMPSPRDAGTNPIAKARVVFYANPGPLSNLANGTFTNLARFTPPNTSIPGNVGSVEYLYVSNDGQANESAVAGTATRNFNFSSTGTKQIFNIPASSTQSVEVQLKGYGIADGRMIPPATFCDANSNGNIQSTQFTMN